MKIIENNYNKPTNTMFPMKIECEHCASKLEIDENDLREGYAGMLYVTCGVCGEKTYIDKLDGKTLTPDNLIFPDNFYHFGGKNIYQLTTEDIKKYIKKAIEFFRSHPDNFCYTSEIGDVFIAVFNYCGDGEYSIVVAKGFYEVEIPFQDADCETISGEAWKNKGVRNKIEKVT